MPFPPRARSIKLVRSPGVEPGWLAPLSSEPSVSTEFPPRTDRSEKWHTGRDSNPQPAVLETAALPIELPVQCESRMHPCILPAHHQPLTHITCFKVCTISPRSGWGIVTTSISLRHRDDAHRHLSVARFHLGADGRTRTDKACAASPSSWCVCQFHHIGVFREPAVGIEPTTCCLQSSGSNLLS